MPLIERDYNLVITHGNGPQVGNILIQNELSKHVVPPMPIDVLVAKSEGHMGYLFQQVLLNHLRRRNIKRYVVTMVTQVMVDNKDKNFNKPTKPVGPFYTKEQAKDMRKKKRWSMMEDAGKGWRRVVPSPKPIKIVQRYMISDLAETGNIVIALGGGGIPIIKNKKGEYIGIEAVVDKDRASANLAGEINVDLFIILTDENKVALNFGKLDEKRLNVLTVGDAERYLKEGHFLVGSMYPKIESAIDFLKMVDGQVLITSPEKLEDALKGKDGTRIVRGYGSDF
jgi:carbamate kinase